jgi:hypothetical protein
MKDVNIETVTHLNFYTLTFVRLGVNTLVYQYGQA